MPCYTVLEWHDVKFNDRDILAQAVTALGWSMSGNYVYTSDGQTMTLDGNNRLGTSAGVDSVNRLKVAYSKEVVKLASQKFGFQRVQQTANKFVITKGV